MGRRRHRARRQAPRRDQRYSGIDDACAWPAPWAGARRIRRAPARHFAAGQCGARNLAGEACRDKLMRLPGFLRDERTALSTADLADAFTLTGFFLERHAFAPRGLPLPEARAHFVTALTRATQQ